MDPRVAIALLVAGALALGAAVLAGTVRHDVAPSGASATGATPSDAETVAPSTAFEGSVLPPDVPAPDFALENQDGELVRMRELRGEPVVVTFLYTTCEESCPPQAQQIKGALDDLEGDVPAIAIAVHPKRDTPERARAFLTEQRMLGRMDFVLGSEAELRPLWRGYAVKP
ncbi:MAG TPA: SCO family protein, partial [Thermoleophilaceae bacterium]|nr:SCO family protein [Thermoleophilaceae bacterium]